MSMANGNFSHHLLVLVDLTPLLFFIFNPSQLSIVSVEKKKKKKFLKRIFISFHDKQPRDQPQFSILFNILLYISISPLFSHLLTTPKEKERSSSGINQTLLENVLALTPSEKYSDYPTSRVPNRNWVSITRSVNESPFYTERTVGVY